MKLYWRQCIKIEIDKIIPSSNALISLTAKHVTTALPYPSSKAYTDLRRNRLFDDRPVHPAAALGPNQRPPHPSFNQRGGGQAAV